MMPLRWVGGASVGLALTLACGPPPPPDEPAAAAEALHARRRTTQNVVILLLDCVRADHVGAYGYERPTTPNIDALAAESVVFEQAISQSNWTKPSIVSLFTGLYLSQHLITEGRLGGRIADDGTVPTGHVMVDDFTTLAEHMSYGGFATGGFVNQGQLPNSLGFAQGFDVYESGLHDPQVEEFFQAWVDQLGDRSFLAYLHLLDLHYPYTTQDHLDIFNDDIADREMQRLSRDAPGEVRARAAAGELTDENIRELAGLYDGELLGVDDRVGRVLRYLKEQGLYDSTMIIVTADHGEAFMEHGYFEHGEDLLYSEMIRVPLILKFPGGEYGGRWIETPAQVIDILPTLQDYFGLPASQAIGGASLLGLIAGTAAAHPVLSEVSDLDARKAFYYGGHKFIFHGDAVPEVFDYVADPLDETNLANEVDAAVIAEARGVLQDLLIRNLEFAAGLPRREMPLNDREIERLRSLGYIR